MASSLQGNTVFLGVLPSSRGQHGFAFAGVIMLVIDRCCSEGLCWEGPPATAGVTPPPLPGQKVAFGKVTKGFRERQEGIPHCAAASQEVPHPPGRISAAAKSSQEGAAPPAPPWILSKSIPVTSTTPHTPEGHAPASSHPPNPSSPPSSFLLPVWMLPIHSELLPITLLLQSSAEAPAPLHCTIFKPFIIIIGFFFFFFSLPQLPKPQAKGSRGSPVHWRQHSPTNP